MASWTRLGDVPEPTPPRCLDPRADPRAAAAGPPPPPGPPPSGSAAPTPGPAGTQHQFACPSCGAALEFAPGTAGLKCPYCGATLEIAAPAAGSTKLNFVAYSGKAALRWGSCHRFACPAATAGAPRRRRRSPVAARPAAGRSSSATTWAGSSRPPTGLCRSSWTRRTRSPRSSSGCRHAGSRRGSSRGWRQLSRCAERICRTGASTTAPRPTTPADAGSPVTRPSPTRRRRTAARSPAPGRCSTPAAHPASGRVSRDFVDLLETPGQPA